MLVRELMSTDVVTVAVDESMATAVGRLLDAGVGSCVVLDEDGTPMGLVTESDALAAAHETGRPLTEITVREVGHRPVVTTTPDRSVSAVVRTMTAEDVKKVPVMSELELVGIITLTDIVWHLSDLKRELSTTDRVRNRWDPS
ncbi:CBS domain-containing protein [Halomicroarcula sp. GCM10025709]|uniref:CBS domain-containing protein n=1 Tax=Haloarcula TaxID=2237 RepID=UPI0024C384E5|nr:CBS domain-containing protein [Halomicroarcula sp. YJ-61-S]